MRTTFFFMVFVIFSGPFVTVAEQLSVSEQAKIDAKAHAKLDINAAANLVGGICLGTAAGYVGMLTGASLLIMEFDSDTCFFGGIGTAVLGTCVLGTAAVHYSTPPHPPPQRLIGKSPEYVMAYAEAYSQKMRSLRVTYFGIGAGVGCAGMGYLVPYVLSNFGD